MLFVALERNSDLVFGALRFLNVLHRLNPTVQFVYDHPSPVVTLRFGSVADRFADDLLMTLYACTESPFNGARPEALAFFQHWVHDDRIAHETFVRIAYTWPWTNRNKYYFLAILFDVHGFGRLMREAGAQLDRAEFLRGLALSLQYRNLISPGQTLAITLTRQDVPEMFALLAWILRDGPRFDALNCLNHWMRCVSGGERVFELLELGSADLLSAERFAYLRSDDFERLVLFRACFKKPFAAAALAGPIDAIIDGRRIDGSSGDIAVKLAQLDVIIANTIARPADIVANLALIAAFMRFTMHEECTALRQSILKLVPNLLYLLAPMLRRPDIEPHAREFFRTLRCEVFEAGLVDENAAYQPVVFAVRLYEVIMKTLYGARTDRIIKRFSDDVNDKIKRFLGEDDTWSLQSPENYSRLFALLRSEFDDVRNVTCELLVRFFPANDIRAQCEQAVRHTDIHQCGYAQLLARVAIGFEGDGASFHHALREIVRTSLTECGQDPLRRMREPGGHLFGGLDAINEFYSRGCVRDDDDVLADVRLAEDIVHVMLGYLQFGGECADRPADGSASFERMDESLTSLVARSAYSSGSDGTEIESNKQWLLLSLWSSLRAACDLGASIGVHIVATGKYDEDSATTTVSRCYETCASVLLQCRHKGAIEAAGLALGRLVRAISTKYTPESTAYGILLASVQRIFAIVDKTDTTRRGAGLSIFVHHLVRNERCAQRPLLAAIMRVLLTQGTEWQATPAANANRDNRLAAVLHFLGSLVKDGELRNVLSAYSAEIFVLAMATIESHEWTVRNAALQLFGAFVPKLVGQSQFFVNELSWQPVYTVYGDVRLKMGALHERIVALLRQCTRPSVRLVTLLELLGRIEVLDVPDDVDAELRALFYRFLHYDSEKVRTLAARCLARFHQWYEVAEFVRIHLRLLPQLRSVNFQHGVVRTVEFMLLKWASDGRYMQMTDADRRPLFEEVRELLLEMRLKVSSYFLRCYLFDLMRLVGCELNEAALLDGADVDVREEVDRLRTHDGQRVAFDAWAEKVLRSTAETRNESSMC